MRVAEKPKARLASCCRVEVMKGGASSASQITEVVTNTYGWNVTKPDVIDKEMWDRIYDVYVEDSYGLGTEQFFRQQNPAALQEITAVMLETARKGMWKASEQQLNTLASLHTELVEEFGSTGSGFSGGNAKLQEFIAGRVAPQHAAAYKQQIQQYINDRRNDQINQRMSAVSNRLQNPYKNIVHDHSDRACKISAEIGDRFRKHLCGCSHQHQDLRC